jgi:hypothetical protein
MRKVSTFGYFGGTGERRCRLKYLRRFEIQPNLSKEREEREYVYAYVYVHVATNSIFISFKMRERR